MSLVKRPTLTPEKLAANRANARQSHGPVTRDGIDRVRAANTRHGFYSKAPGTQISALSEEPVLAPQNPGTLYQTRNTYLLDCCIARARMGQWFRVFGPCGTQKSHLFSYRVWEDWQARQGRGMPSLIYFEAMDSMSPTDLLGDICRCLGISSLGHVGAKVRNIIGVLERARAAGPRCPVIIVDEAQRLGGNRSTIEYLRTVADRNRAGLILVGHEDLNAIFTKRHQGRIHGLAQFEGRTDEAVELPGLDIDEVRKIVRAETAGLGKVPDAVMELAICHCRVSIPGTSRCYHDARRLIKPLRELVKALSQGSFVTKPRQIA